MTDPLLFVLGSIITAFTLAAVLLVGQSEARDPAHNRPADDDTD